MPDPMRQTGVEQESFDSPLDAVRFTISVSPAHVRGAVDLLSTERIRARVAALAPRIYDINFTHHLIPFTRDAYGVYLTPEENEAHLRQVFALQEHTGITASAVFNNILVPNTEEALRGFIRSLGPLVEQGLRSITVPHVLWMKMGLLQREFPDLTLKNTVLRRVRTGQDLWNHAEAGYDYINVDRVVLRDQRTLRELRAAQRAFERATSKRVIISVLHGEGCLGHCALFDEHYHHSLTHPGVDKNVVASSDAFRLPTQYSCLAVGHPNVNLPRNVGLPYFMEDLQEVSSFFDVVKLAGRHSFLSIGDCLSAIEHFGKADGPLARGTPEELHRLLADPAARPTLERWRVAIKDCRYQCWRCSLCTELATYLG